MEKEDNVQRMDTREHRRPKRGGPTRPDPWDAWAHLTGASGAASPSAFRVPPHIYEKVGALRGGELFAKHTAAATTIFVFGDRLL